jgi:hypothetical protein
MSGPSISGGGGIDPGLMDSRAVTSGGWSTPSNQQHDRSRQGSLQGTPNGLAMNGYIGDDGYVR